MARVRQSMADISKPAQDLQQSVSYGVKQQPDKYAQLLQIEQQTGVKPQMSKDYQEYLKAHIDANSIDYNQFAADNPKTTDWASDPDNAAIAGVQEIQRLGAIEAQATNGSRLAGLTPSQQQAVIEDRQRVYWQRFEASHAAPGDVMARARSTAADATRGFFGFAKPMVDAVGDALQNTRDTKDALVDWAGGWTKLPSAIADTDKLPPELVNRLGDIWGGSDASITRTATDKFMNYIGTPVLSDPSDYLRDPQTGKLFKNPDAHWYQKLAHVPGSVGGAALAMSLVPKAAGGLMAPYMGLGAAREGYQEALDSGADTQTALATAIGKGLLTYALMGHMPEVTPKWGVPGIVGQAAARSVVMGVGQTVGENLLSRTYEPDRPLFQGWQDNLSTMAAFEGIGAVHNVVNLAADSKLRERSKEKFAEGMAKATEGKPLANMRIPVDRWDEYWQQQKQDPAEVAAGLGVSQGYGEAKLGAGGDDLVIPTSDFTAKLDPKHFTGLLPDMRGYDQFGRPTQTARELAEEQTPEGQARIAQAREDVRSRMQQADEETQSTPEWTEVKERIRQQMIAAGSTPEFAETQSTLEANVFANLGRPEGYNPVEAYEVMNPKVVRGEAPGFEASETELGDAAILRQSGTFGPVHEDFHHDAPGAIQRLLADKSGEASGALHHPAVGDFDLIYGKERSAENDGFGLAKIAQLHPEVLADLQGFIDGLHEISRSTNRVRLADDFGTAVVRLSREGANKPWLMTAFKKGGGTSGAAEGGRTAVTDRTEPAPENPAGQEAPDAESIVARGPNADNTETLYQQQSTRVPTAAGNTEDHIGNMLLSDYQALRNAKAGATSKGVTPLEKTAYTGELSEPGVSVRRSGELGSGARERAARGDSEAVVGPGQPLYQAARGEDQPRGWSRSLPDGSIEVGRTDKADPTTDSHEWGHVYLKLIKKLIDRPGASDVLKRDHETILKFLGATDLDHLTREQHEKFTEAISLWRSQGKSASPSMRGVMQRFGIWLNNIFQKASDLGVKLSPEMNDFMERMHAAEEGIANARAEAGDKMFTSADQVGWTEEQFKQYAEDHQVSIEQAKETVLKQMNEARLREKTQDWRDEEKNVRAAITEQIDQRPEYAAIRQLRKGAMDDGNPLTMNKDLLVKQFGEERAKALQKLHPGLYRADGGIEPETAAEMLGFTSAEEMMQALESTPRRAGAIEAATRQYMTQQHGDIRYDGTLGDQSRIALENEKLLDVKYRELQALRKKNAELQAAADKEKAGRRAITIAPQEDYRTFARETIAAKSPKEIQPARYLDASRKFSRMAFDALRRGDYEKAEEAKHKELVNHYMFTEAIKTQKYLEQFEANNKRDQRKSVQSKLGLAGEDHQDQFNYLAGRYGAGPQTPPPERSLVEWANAMNDLGRDPAIDPSLFREGQPTHWRNVPVSQIRLVDEALTNIKKLAYQELEQVVGGKRINYERSIGEMVDRARETGKSRPVRILKRNQTIGEWWRELPQRGDAMAVRMEFLMHDLDGGPTGPFHDYIWNLSADAQGREMALHAQTTKLVGEALENMTPEERKSRMEKVTIPGINETVTRHDLISWVFNMGNDGNLDRLRKTFIESGWDPSVIPSLPGLLRPNELRYIQDVAQSLIPLGKEQFDLERRQTGLAPVMVEPRPFTTTTADGTEMHMDGWYYPIQMDPRFSVRGALQDTGATAQNMMEAGYGRAATSRGAMKQRTGFGGALDMDYEQVLTQHVGKVVKDITYREFMLAANKMLTDPRMRQVLRERLGEKYEEQFMPWLRSQINDRNGSAVQGLSEFSKLIRVLRTNLVKAALTFKASTLLLQTTHASSILLHVSPGEYAQSLIQFLASPKEMTQQIKDMSPNEMRFRGDNYERDMRAMLQDKNYGKGFKPAYERTTTTVAKAGMYPVLMMDHLLSFPLWHAAYQKGLLENVHLSEDDAHYKAMHKADGAVRMALGSSAPKDLPAVMRQNDMLKLLTMMQGFHNLKYNQIRGLGTQLGRDVRAGEIGRGAMNLTYGYAMAALIPSILGSYVTGKGPKDGENVGLWAVRKALLFPAETIPLLGSVVEALDNREEDVSFSPIANYFSRGYKVAKQLDPENENERDWTGLGMNALQTAMDALGVPGTDQAFKTLRYVRKASNDQIENPNPWDAVMGAPRH